MASVEEMLISITYPEFVCARCGDKLQGKVENFAPYSKANDPRRRTIVTVEPCQTCMWNFATS